MDEIRIIELEDKMHALEKEVRGIDSGIRKPFKCEGCTTAYFHVPIKSDYSLRKISARTIRIELYDENEILGWFDFETSINPKSQLHRRRVSQ